MFKDFQTEWKLFGAIFLISVISAGIFFGLQPNRNILSIIIFIIAAVLAAIFLLSVAMGEVRRKNTSPEEILRQSQDPRVIKLTKRYEFGMWLYAILILIFLVFIVIVSLYGAWRKSAELQQVSSQQQIQQTEIDTSTWKTYRNEEFGFEVKYPKNWVLQEKKEISNVTTVKIEGLNNSVVLIRPEGFAAGSLEGVNLREELRTLGGKSTQSTEYFTEGGELWMQFIRFSEIPQFWKEYNYILTRVDFLNREIRCAIEITIDHPECGAGDGLLVFGSVDKNEQEIINQILSTFRFIDEKDIVSIDISSVDTSDWRGFIPYGKIVIRTPKDWYPRTYVEEPNAVTYGSGIASFLTLRYFSDPTIKQQRIDKFLQDGRSVIEEIVRIGEKEFTRHTIGGKCVSDDVCNSGFRDWYVMFDNDIFIFSENAWGKEEKMVVATVIASTSKFSSDFDEQ